ncbi:hypothetical protein KPH14_004458 [Odynerus spinipes]|uniref:Large ribosomal subunit protein mL64 n=1 Tax=Odynerus spinipes TaxID=1348599 RepID=A0AAD9RZG9_9HYME|nr:hypothetical protein KPH14_004458 [Odynerus spinipes]
MSLKILFNVNTPLCMRIQNILNRRCFASSTTQKDVTPSGEKSLLEAAEEVPIFVDVESEEDKIEIEKKRNKSRLNPQHRNILFGQRPYDKPIEWFHNTVKYKKRTLGKYGLKAVEVPAGFAWPTVEEVEDMKEYERVAYPHSIQEEWTRIEKKNKEEAEAIKAREADISAKMIKMEKWITELNVKLAKKEAEMLEAKRLRERLIEEVRSELGVTVSIYDDKFKEALAQKEKEERKKQKAAKKKLREETSSPLKDSTQINQGVLASSSVGEPSSDIIESRCLCQKSM